MSSYARDAFPNKGDGHPYDGMTIRQWYKGQAVVGLLSKYDPREGVDFEPLNPSKQEHATHVAIAAACVADAMEKEDAEFAGKTIGDMPTYIGLRDLCDSRLAKIVEASKLLERYFSAGEGWTAVDPVEAVRILREAEEMQ